MTEPKFFTVYDKGRQLDFEGFHLSSSSSYAPGKSRYFVVDIYKTIGGKYIVAGQGRSNVVHRENCAQMKEKNVKPSPSTKSSIPCTTCRPNLNDNVVHEVNREWAQVSEDAAAIIERLKLKDADGVWYLPKTSSSALITAAESDTGIKYAFYAPQRIE